MAYIAKARTSITIFIYTAGRCELVTSSQRWNYDLAFYFGRGKEKVRLDI